jgi:SAM-dependent methyltransferase
MQYLSACPICKGSDLVPFLSCKDHSVSHETFDLQKCAQCGLVMTNPRPEEQQLGRYYASDAYISHSNKSPNLIGRIYKASRWFTLKWKLNLIEQHSAITPRSVLDFGCGTGSFLQVCKKNNLTVSGVEPAPLARAQANKNTETEIYPALSHVTGQFDVITLWHVLEHVAELNETLYQLKTRLVKSGTMFIAVPNLQSKDANQYREHWAALDVPRHLWHFQRPTMQKALEKHGLTCIKVLPMKLDAYYVSLLSEKYKNSGITFPNMAKAVYYGWRSNRAAIKTKEYSSLIYIVRA